MVTIYWPSFSALIGTRAAIITASVNSRAPKQEGMSPSFTAIVLQGTKSWIPTNDIAGDIINGTDDAASGCVLNQIVTLRNQVRITATVSGSIASDNRVLESEVCPSSEVADATVVGPSGVTNDRAVDER